MKRISIFIIACLYIVFIASGCAGRSEASFDDYKLPESSSPKVISSYNVINMSQDSVGEFKDAIARGDEEKEEYYSDFERNIYSGPSKTSSKLGRLPAGSYFEVIGMTEDQGWYLIVYNGRIAYTTTSWNRQGASAEDESDSSSTEETSEGEDESETSEDGGGDSDDDPGEDSGEYYDIQEQGLGDD